MTATSPPFAGYSFRKPTEERLRLSTPGCVILRRGGLPVQRRSPHPGTNRAWHTVTIHVQCRSYADRDKRAKRNRQILATVHQFRRLLKTFLSASQLTTVHCDWLLTCALEIFLLTYLLTYLTLNYCRGDALHQASGSSMPNDVESSLLLDECRGHVVYSRPSPSQSISSWVFLVFLSHAHIRGVPVSDNRLRGSASTVLTATGQVNGI